MRSRAADVMSPSSSMSTPCEAQQIIYLDHNATTPVFLEVAQAIQDLLPEHWG